MTFLDPNTGCFVWMGHRDQKGYGKVFHAGSAKLVHRLSFEVARGSIPEGLDIDHVCAFKSCLNPDHLEPVTAAENNRRASHRRGLKKMEVA